MEQRPDTRIINGVLWPLELPALRWLSSHMPARVTPDQLTAIGVFGALLGFGGYTLSTAHPAFLWLVNLGLVANWFGDSLDGTLARFRRIERPRYGHFIDKTTDLLNDTLFTLGLGLSPFVRFEVACLALIAYLLITGFTLVREQVSKTVQISFGGVGPTEVRALLITFNICLYAIPTKIVLVLWAPLTLADVCVLTVSAAGFILFLFLVISEAQKLAVEDPPPTRRTADLAKRDAEQRPRGVDCNP